MAEMEQDYSVYNVPEEDLKNAENLGVKDSLELREKISQALSGSVSQYYKDPKVRPNWLKRLSDGLHIILGTVGVIVVFGFLVYRIFGWMLMSPQVGLVTRIIGFSLLMLLFLFISVCTLHEASIRYRDQGVDGLADYANEHEQDIDKMLFHIGQMDAASVP